VGWIGTSTCTANSTTHRADWDIDTINSKNFKGSVQSDWDIDPGLHNSCSAVDASHHPLPRTKTSLLPAQRRIYCLLYLFLIQRKGRKKRSHRPHRSTRRRTQASNRPPRTLNVTSRKGMTPVAPLTLSRDGKGFPCKILEVRNGES
jgi:hypothetical protein